MAVAANWVFVTLLFSLCLSTSFSAMDGGFEKEAFQSSSGFMHDDVDHVSSYSTNPHRTGSGSTRSRGRYYFERNPDCVDCDNIDIVGGGCGCGTDFDGTGDSGVRDYGYNHPCSFAGGSGGFAYLTGIKQKVEELALKLDALRQTKAAMDVEATAP